MLELGCGAAALSCRLAKLGARPVGLDVSPRQIDLARRLQAEHGVEFPLVEAAGEDVPLPDAAFDLVVSDYGAATWGEPERVVAEAARLLRPGGVLVILSLTPLAELCLPGGADALGERLVNDYFGLRGFEDPEDGSTTYNLPYGEWIRLFRANGLTVEDLVEIRPPEDASSRHTHVPLEWARRWPAEHVWRVSKPG